MKGQYNLMEYVLLTLFVLLIIVMITFFLTWWQISTTGSEQRRITHDRAEFLLRAFTNSPYINKNTYPEGSMLEDSKLSSITCQDLQNLYGEKWFAEIESYNFNVECNEDNPYPYCGKWSYCKKEADAMIFELPVNIYKKTTGEIDIGYLRVGLYHE